MRTAIFDLDGTLVESAADLHAASNRMLDELSLAPLELAELKSFVGNGVPTLVRRCLEARDVGDDPDLAVRALAIFTSAYEAAPVDLTHAYEGVPEALEALKAGGWALGVCTNKPQRPAELVLEGLGLAGYFGAVVGGDVLPVLKPDPAPLIHCLTALGGDPAQAIFVGDSEVDAATAAAAKMPFAIYTKGYLRSPLSDVAHTAAFDDFRDLAGLLSTLRPAA